GASAKIAESIIFFCATRAPIDFCTLFPRSIAGVRLFGGVPVFQQRRRAGACRSCLQTLAWVSATRPGQLLRRIGILSNALHHAGIFPKAGEVRRNLSAAGLDNSRTTLSR